MLSKHQIKSIGFQLKDFNWEILVQTQKKDQFYRYGLNKPSISCFFIVTILFTDGNVFEVSKVLNSNNIISSNIAMLVLIFFNDHKPVSLKTRILSMMNNIAKIRNI